MFVIMITLMLMLSVLLLMVFLMLSYLNHNFKGEKMSPFECGFDPLSKMRSPFSTRFFLLVVLFLIFDVEIALIFPLLTMMQAMTNIYMMLSLTAFLGVLLGGVFHEWNEGMLDWMSV